ncbi:hypothetical protein INS49_005414 [Diaporthe citri]|uniref:uncharacterized protein n=1 Tax=Diaporthe citri TaxID=83186 RepID=UPI001C80784A|nr:uncharacterized protein INS49_005414 [Diaporthe citri]KAG6353705.1 hypothetical protein INS49_005414 [Diaporthe citri]
MLTKAAGSPLPSITDDERHHSEKRAIIGNAPLEDWEVALLILGALFGIMLIGAVGGICEVVLAGRIKESNAEADAKLEANGNRAIAEEAEGGKTEGQEGVIDPDRYSWQPERMTTGLSDDSTLAGSDPGVSQSDVSQGERAMAEEGDWYPGSEGAQQAASVPWTSEGLPLPDSSQFVIDDVDSPGYGETHGDAQSYEAYPGHLNPPPPMPRDNTMQQQDAEDQYWNEENNGTSGAGSSQAEYNGSSADDYNGQSMMVPPGAYSGEGYSPAVMPDSADYLSEY